MGLVRAQDIRKAPAGTETAFYADGTASVEWFGDLALLMRTPAIYLDLALNKDRKSDALAFLSIVEQFTQSTFSEASDFLALPGLVPFAYQPTVEPTADTVA